MTSVVCQVCGTALERSSAVHCPTCDTPHHADCWEYLKGCSTYACASVCYDAPVVVREHAVAAASERTEYLGSLPLVAAPGKVPVLYFGAGGEDAPLRPGESAVQVTDEVLEGIGLSLSMKLAPRSRKMGLLPLTMMVASSAFFALGSHLMGAVCFVLTVTLAVREGDPPLPPHRAWLVKTAAGALVCQLTWEQPPAVEEAQHPRLALVPNYRRRGRALAPTLIRLNFHVRCESGGEGPAWREFVLQLHFRDQTELNLLPPFRAPLQEQPRAEFLQQLAEARATGRQLSAFWSIPYEESFASDGGKP